MVSVGANLGIIVQMSVIQVEQELCVNSKDKQDIDSCVHYGLQVVALLFGFLIMCMAEPLAIIAYVLRAVRLKKIFDA